jgi:hypothetical protein
VSTRFKRTTQTPVSNTDAAHASPIVHGIGQVDPTLETFDMSLEALKTMCRPSNPREKPGESHPLQSELDHGVRLGIQTSRYPSSTPEFALWPHFKRILEYGSDLPRDRLDEDSRKLALEAALVRGNHKSTMKDDEGLAALLINDVTRGYNLPLPLDQVHNIPGLSLQPMGITIQNTINEHYLIVSKKRLTHDSTFEFLEGVPSHNKRIQMEDLVACRFGWALLRIMHLVVSLRQRNPTTPIYTQKVDWSKAYRREHYSASAALECATQCGDLLLVPLRLTFGGASNASEFCNCSETVCDITNELLHCEDWDPSEVYHRSKIRFLRPH